jgi:hypothetical protein
MRKLFTSLALAAAIAPAALSAQSTTALAPVTPAPAVALAPAPSSSMARADVAGIQVKSDANAPLALNSTVAAEGLHQGEGVALMAVGGAGLIAGLLIGDSAGTAVAIGGLAVGLVGLYEYVR